MTAATRGDRSAGAEGPVGAEAWPERRSGGSPRRRGRSGGRLTAAGRRGRSGVHRCPGLSPTGALSSSSLARTATAADPPPFFPMCSSSVAPLLLPVREQQASEGSSPVLPSFRPRTQQQWQIFFPISICAAAGKQQVLLPLCFSPTDAAQEIAYESATRRQPALTKSYSF
ncbi:hypothetical protein BS78_K310300 [Paspalum vaginatum]|uniref:Uncharacterized protein n=1 Tax=Paspalum vaginatum TaxID=158149 RepID=A0A9W7X7U3_9POAL|nr:hypothetical protein BS78_K310300 [Paspalum vaginatum]